MFIKLVPCLNPRKRKNQHFVACPFAWDDLANISPKILAFKIRTEQRTWLLQIISFNKYCRIFLHKRASSFAKKKVTASGFLKLAFLLYLMKKERMWTKSHILFHHLWSEFHYYISKITVSFKRCRFTLNEKMARRTTIRQEC